MLAGLHTLRRIKLRNRRRKIWTATGSWSAPVSQAVDHGANSIRVRVNWPPIFSTATRTLSPALT